MKGAHKTQVRLANALKHKMVMTSEELVKILGNRMRIKRLADSGVLMRIGSGFYATPALDPFSAMVIAASKYYPGVIISSLTALVLHGLSDESLDRVDVDIAEGKSLRNRMLRVHRVSKRARFGTIKMDFHGYQIRTFDLERSLCEAYRFNPSGPIFFKALKRYLKKGRPKMEIIAAYDRKLGSKVLDSLRQELADA
jgi:predicted transcriptional regulator of viral defense system